MQPLTPTMTRTVSAPPDVSVCHAQSPADRGPADDFAFFREPLRRDRVLRDQWSAAAGNGAPSGMWSRFVHDVGERFFKGSRKQRVMDALVLSLDLLPERRRADALGCLLADGVEGRAAVKEFWPYVGMDRIPEVDKGRVCRLLREYEIGR